MRYISVNEGTICGETPTLAATLLFQEVTEQPLEQSAGTAARILNVFGAEALTEATTPGHGYMKRCRDNMRSVLGEADTLKSAGTSPGLMWKKRRILNIKRPTSKRMSLYFYKWWNQSAFYVFTMLFRSYYIYVFCQFCCLPDQICQLTLPY